MIQRLSLKTIATALLVCLLALIIVLSLLFPPSEHLPVAQWGAQLESFGAGGMLFFLLAAALFTAVGLPRQLVAFMAGLAYGVSQGILLSLMAAICGCWLTATVSRRFFAKWVSARFPAPIALLEKFTAHDLFLKILVLRLQPLGTNFITNVSIGFTNASFRRFMAASAVGYVPQMLVFNLLGAGVRVDSQSQLILSLVLLAVSVAIGALLYKRHIGMQRE